MTDKPKNLILVKHSLPEILPTIPASQWQLSDEGQARCRPLAEKLSKYRPKAIFSSLEPKAIKTAKLAAKGLGLENRALPGLHEHLRQTADYLGSKAAFQDTIARFFAQPDQVVFGEESAIQAQARFNAAVNALLKTHPNQTITIVAHGTVITLFVALYNSINLYQFWERLTLPAFVVLTRPSLALAETVLLP